MEKHRHNSRITPFSMKLFFQMQSLFCIILCTSRPTKLQEFMYICVAKGNTVYVLYFTLPARCLVLQAPKENKQFKSVGKDIWIKDFYIDKKCMLRPFNWLFPVLSNSGVSDLLSSIRTVINIPLLLAIVVLLLQLVMEWSMLPI